jgi:hypothetical protein
MRESTSSNGEHVKLEPHFVVKPFYRYEQMGIEMNKAFLLAACCFIGACSSGYHPLYYFNEVQVVNLSGEEIRDVSLRVVDSGKRLDCEEVAKFAMCHDRFGRKRYPQQGLELSWTQAIRMCRRTFRPAWPCESSSRSDRTAVSKPFTNRKSRAGARCLTSSPHEPPPGECVAAFCAHHGNGSLQQ